MRSQALSRQLQQIRWLIRRSRDASGEEVELQGHWGRYLCVLVAGFIENAYAEVFGNFVQSASSAPVARFASRALRRVQNPKATRFIETASAFKEVWGASLEAFMEEEGRRNAIDSIMNNRHQIAHGGQSTITVARVGEYLNKCVEVLEFIEAQVSE